MLKNTKFRSALLALGAVASLMVALPSQAHDGYRNQPYGGYPPPPRYDRWYGYGRHDHRWCDARGYRHDGWRDRRDWDHRGDRWDHDRHDRNDRDDRGRGDREDDRDRRGY